jgi:hypothetical protein
VVGQGNFYRIETVTPAGLRLIRPILPALRAAIQSVEKLPKYDNILSPHSFILYPDHIPCPFLSSIFIRVIFAGIRMGKSTGVCWNNATREMQMSENLSGSEQAVACFRQGFN